MEAPDKGKSANQHTLNRAIRGMGALQVSDVRRKATSQWTLVACGMSSPVPCRLGIVVLGAIFPSPNRIPATNRNPLEIRARKCNMRESAEDLGQTRLRGALPEATMTLACR
jgi:hypothetical protein